MAVLLVMHVTTARDGVRGQVEVDGAVNGAHVLVAGKSSILHHAIHDEREAIDDGRHGTLQSHDALARHGAHVSR